MIIREPTLSSSLSSSSLPTLLKQQKQQISLVFIPASAIFLVLLILLPPQCYLLARLGAEHAKFVRSTTAYFGENVAFRCYSCEDTIEKCLRSEIMINCGPHEFCITKTNATFAWQSCADPLVECPRYRDTVVTQRPLTTTPSHQRGPLKSTKSSEKDINYLGRKLLKSRQHQRVRQKKKSPSSLISTSADDDDRPLRQRQDGQDNNSGGGDSLLFVDLYAYENAGYSFSNSTSSSEDDSHYYLSFNKNNNKQLLPPTKAPEGDDDEVTSEQQITITCCANDYCNCLDAQCFMLHDDEEHKEFFMSSVSTLMPTSLQRHIAILTTAFIIFLENIM